MPSSGNAAIPIVAPRDRNLHRGASLLDARPDPADDRPGALGGLLAEQQGELVAADAADDVVGAGRVVQQAGDGLDQLIAHQVALGVVDRLQPAHVDVGEHERTLVAAARASSRSAASVKPRG